MAECARTGHCAPYAIDVPNDGVDGLLLRERDQTMFVYYLCISFVSLSREKGIVGRARRTSLTSKFGDGESAARADRPQRPRRVIEPLAEKE